MVKQLMRARWILDGGNLLASEQLKALCRLTVQCTCRWAR